MPLIQPKGGKGVMYLPLPFEWLRTNGHDDVSLQSSVLGLLGPWNIDNEAVNTLDPSMQTCSEKLCAADSIERSQAIWKVKG